LQIKLEVVNQFDWDEGGGCIQRAQGLIVQWEQYDKAVIMVFIYFICSV
jgi:hypothetical protein